MAGPPAAVIITCIKTNVTVDYIVLGGALIMKISLNWLNDYIETGLSAEQIAEVLSDIGFPYEAIEHLDDDAIIDLEVTSNRGDCLSYIGIARELAAFTGKDLKIPQVELPQSDKQTSDLVSVEIAEPEFCGRYTARIIEAVTVGPSPDWLRKRIEAVGIRSVNNVVDATNYAMLETGQPPHAFDYEKISEGKIVVRKAVLGERIISIDGSKCDLAEDMLIIADAHQPIAIAGVMGGLETEVSQTTKTILLEDASFDPVTVRTTSRKLALPSEAAFRFERTVDIEMIDWASQRTAQLICQAAGGKIAKSLVDVYPEKPAAKKVTLRLERLKKLLGIDIPAEDSIRILSKLGFTPKKQKDSLICSVPSWRSDIYREVDLIEEVARVHGYDKVPIENKISIEVAPVDSRQRLVNSIATFLNGCGFYETINVTFVDDAVAGLFSEEKNSGNLAVQDVSRKSANLLRRNLIGSLLGVLKTNFNAKNIPCRIFEIADTFIPATAGSLPVERTKLSLVCDSDFALLRGAVEGLIKNIAGDADITFEPVELLWAQNGAEIKINGRLIGTAGIVNDAVKENFDFKEADPCAAELDFESLLALETGPVKIKPIPRFPAIERDLSVIIDEQTSWANIADAIKHKTTDKLEVVNFVGIYRGKGIEPGKKSLTLSLRFRDEDGTLTHEQVDSFQADIVKSLTSTIGAELRTV
jgi:phenylalanyl-tRNA synthetase beta chain